MGAYGPVPLSDGDDGSDLVESGDEDDSKLRKTSHPGEEGEDVCIEEEPGPVLDDPPPEESCWDDLGLDDPW